MSGDTAVEYPTQHSGLSSQSELKSPRKFRLLDFFFSYFFCSLLFMFAHTQLLASFGLSLYGDRLGISSRAVFRAPWNPETFFLRNLSWLFCFVTPLEDLENNENMITQCFSIGRCWYLNPQPGTSYVYGPDGWSPAWSAWEWYMFEKLIIQAEALQVL